MVEFFFFKSQILLACILEREREREQKREGEVDELGSAWPVDKKRWEGVRPSQVKKISTFEETMLEEI